MQGLKHFIFAPPVIAHRGASSMAPENTLAAFQKAKQLGLNWVEFDVMLSADGEVFVIHDEELSRTTTGTGLVAQKSDHYLKSLDAGSWFSPHFVGEKIPTLSEVLDLLVSCQLSANLEIKTVAGLEDQVVKKVFDILYSHVKYAQIPLLISSFSYPVLEWVKKISPQSKIGFLMHELLSDWPEKCAELNAVAVDVNHEILNPMLIQKIKATNRLLLSYTVNQPDRAKELLHWGVDAVFSDCPLGLLQALKISI